MNEEKCQAMRKNCALYARSPRPGSGGQSIEVQIANCRAAAQHLGWAVAEHHVFSDEGLNSRKPIDSRPGLATLLAASRSEACSFDGVFVDELKHFSRRVAEILGIYSTLSRTGVAVHVAACWLKPSDPEEEGAAGLK